jgi:hypothetical protein
MLALLGIIPTIASLLKAFFGMKTTQATTAANQAINQINAQAGVQESEGHYPINAFTRALYAVPFALYYSKVIIVDKLLGWGVTDPLSPHLTTVSLVVLGFYFLTTVKR